MVEAVNFEKAHALDRFLRNPYDAQIIHELKKYYTMKTLVVKSKSDKFNLEIDMKTLDGNFRRVVIKKKIELFQINLPAGERYSVKALRTDFLFFKKIESKEIVLKDDTELEF